MAIMPWQFAIPAAGETATEEERLESEVDASTRTGCCTGNQANADCIGSQQANAKANSSVQRDIGDSTFPFRQRRISTLYKYSRSIVEQARQAVQP